MSAYVCMYICMVIESMHLFANYTNINVYEFVCTTENNKNNNKLRKVGELNSERPRRQLTVLLLVLLAICSPA